MCSLSEPPADGRGGEIDEAILGGPALYTKHDVADAAGVDLQRAESLWQAMGFAHVEDDAVVFGDADVAALRALVELVSAQVITSELETAVARSLAQTMSRLAEWQPREVAGCLFNTWIVYFGSFENSNIIVMYLA